jgi:putative transposase
VRHGSDDGLVTLGRAARCRSRRPRLRSADRSAEVPLPTYQWANVDRAARARDHGQDAGQALHPPLRRRASSPWAGHQATSRSTSKSAVSRRFVAATESALAELMTADLSGLDLVAIMVDGVHFAEHLCVCALGIGIDGTKHPLALSRATPRTPRSVSASWSICVAGPRRDQADLFVLDGAKALSSAVKAVFDHPVIARCEEHKVRNVRRPPAQGRRPDRRAPHACRLRNPDPLVGQGDLEALATELDRSHPGAAGSLREGLAETFTISRLGVPPTLGPHPALVQLPSSP